MFTIEVQKLSKTYRTYKKKPGLLGAIQGLYQREYETVHAAREISFCVEPGEFVGFLGPNGAGKTTTLKMLAGLLHPSSGSATVLGFTPWERKNDFKRRFSLVMGQKNALWWDLPALDSLELSRVIYGLDDVLFRKRLDQLVDLLEVREKLQIMVRELSLGERMKFELINALLHGPEVLLLDEPTIGLDVTSQKKVRDFLKYYNTENHVTILLTSHYMQDIQELCSRVMIVDHGGLCYDGALQSILEKFADHKIVKFTASAGLDLLDAKSWGEVLTQEATALQIKVPRERISDTCREILASREILDLTVEEVPIEEVIRNVFADQTNRS